MDTIFIKDSIEPVVSALSGATRFSLDIETTGLNPYDSRILLVQIGVGNTVFVIDYAKVDVNPIMPFMENPNITTIIHNAKFESSFIYHYHKVMIIGIWDTFLAERVIDPDNFMASLAATTKKYTGREMDKGIRTSFVGMKGGDFTDEQIAYAALDAEILFPIMDAQKPKLESLQLLPVAELEFSLAPITARMELTGVPLDEKGWRKRIHEYKDLFKQSHDRMYVELFDSGGLDEQMGMFERSAINLGSSKQVLEAFQKLGFNIDGTDERTIKQIKHPAAEALTEYRRIEKILKAYSDTFLEKIHPFTGRIHPDYQQMGTETGRFSCKEPNVQQIPQEFRKYVTDPNYSIISADYAQIELRILAEVSKDQRLVGAFQSGEDLHRVTASVMFNTDLANVTSEQRSMAKTLNFGIMYGMGGSKLMDKLNETRAASNQLTLPQTMDIHERYKKTYSRAMWWLKAAGERAWTEGVSKTIYGRKRFYERPTGAMDDKAYMRQMLGLKRQGANAVIQGTSADMTKLAMTELQERLDYEGYRANIIIQVHDELVVLAHKSQSEAVSTVVKESMQKAGEKLVKSVPILVDTHISDVWSKG